MGALRTARGKHTGGELVEDGTVIPELPPAATSDAPEPAAPAVPVEAPPLLPAGNGAPEESFIASLISSLEKPQPMPIRASQHPADIGAGAKQGMGDQARPHPDDMPEPVTPSAPVEGYLNAVDALIQRVLPGSRADTSTTEAADALQQLRGMVAGAQALGLQAQLAQVFRRHGPSGEQLLKTALSPLPNKSPAQEALRTKASGAMARAPLSPVPAAAADAARQQQQQQQHQGGGGGDVFGAISKLVAAPITIPIAAGSLVWQRLANRFGPRPAIPANADAFSVMKNQFDDACNRAIAKISHIRSGPMNPHLSEIVANPLKLDEQFQRMGQDASGEFHDRAQRLKETLNTPEVQRQYAELRAALEEIHHRSERLAQAGVDRGVPIDEHIAERVEALAHKTDGLPALGKDGRLQQLKESIRELVERIQEFLRDLFGKPGATPA